VEGLHKLATLGTWVVFNGHQTEEPQTEIERAYLDLFVFQLCALMNATLLEDKDILYNHRMFNATSKQKHFFVEEIQDNTHLNPRR
jgi:hypothetical protein